MVTLDEIDRLRVVANSAHEEAQEVRRVVREEWTVFDGLFKKAIGGEGEPPSTKALVVVSRRLREVEVREMAARDAVDRALDQRQAALEYHDHEIDGGALLSLLAYVDEAVAYLRDVPAAKATSLDENIRSCMDEIRKHMTAARKADE